jgi:hypothetical protein
MVQNSAIMNKDTLLESILRILMAADVMKYVLGFNYKRILNYKTNKWNTHLPAEIGIDGCYHIVNNQQKCFFCVDEGLVTLKEGKWTILNQKNSTRALNKVYYAKKDLKNRFMDRHFKGSLQMKMVKLRV